MHRVLFFRSVCWNFLSIFICTNVIIYDPVQIVTTIFADCLTLKQRSKLTKFLALNGEYFLIHHFRICFWVLKRTLSLRLFFCVPTLATAYVLFDNKKLFLNTNSYLHDWLKAYGNNG